MTEVKIRIPSAALRILVAISATHLAVSASWADACVDCQQACFRELNDCRESGAREDSCLSQHGDKAFECKKTCKGLPVCTLGGTSTSGPPARPSVPPPASQQEPSEDGDSSEPIPPAPPAQNLWNHNGSVMKLVANGDRRVFVYVEPREGIRRMGATSGTRLFEGLRHGNTYTGVSLIFRGSCGTFAYNVSGNVEDGERRIVMLGQAPLVDGSCRITGYKDDVLVFERME